jgi:transposase-like protein
MTSLKLIFDKEIRRAGIIITPEDPFTFVKLNCVVVKLFPALQNKPYQLCYNDDENDLVTFSSDEELNEAVKFMLPRSSTVKFTIEADVTKDEVIPSVILPSVVSTPRETLAALLTNISSTVSPSPLSTVATVVSQSQQTETSPENNENGGYSTMIGFKRRRSYTVGEKYEIVQEYLNNRNNMTQFALEKNIKPKTFSAWMKEYQDGKLSEHQQQQNQQQTPPPLLLSASVTLLSPLNNSITTSIATTTTALLTTNTVHNFSNTISSSSSSSFPIEILHNNNTTVTPTSTSGGNSKRFRIRKAEYPEIEKKLIEFITNFDPTQTITWALIRTTALIYAKEFLKNDEEALFHFKASDGWIQNFLKRNQIILKKSYVVQIGGMTILPQSSPAAPVAVAPMNAGILLPTVGVASVTEPN